MRRRPIRLLFPVLVALCLGSSFATAQPAAPAPAAVTDADRANAVKASPFDDQPIKRGDGTRTAAAAANTTTRPASASTGRSSSLGVDATRMLVALAIVIALIMLARWLFKRFFVAASAPAASKTVRVLSRTSLAPRQQVLLLQVGRRVLVVGDSNGQLATLGQMEDPDEVAQLVGQLQTEQMQRAASFGGLFGRAQKDFEADAAGASQDAPHDERMEREPAHADVQPSPEEAAVQSELTGLLDKVRSIRSQLGR